MSSERSDESHTEECSFTNNNKITITHSSKYKYTADDGKLLSDYTSILTTNLQLNDCSSDGISVTEQPAGALAGLFKTASGPEHIYWVKIETVGHKNSIKVQLKTSGVNDNIPIDETKEDLENESHLEFVDKDIANQVAENLRRIIKLCNQNNLSGSDTGVGIGIDEVKNQVKQIRTLIQDNTLSFKKKCNGDTFLISLIKTYGPANSVEKRNGRQIYTFVSKNIDLRVISDWYETNCSIIPHKGYYFNFSTYGWLQAMAVEENPRLLQVWGREEKLVEGASIGDPPQYIQCLPSPLSNDDFYHLSKSNYYCCLTSDSGLRHTVATNWRFFHTTFGISDPNPYKEYTDTYPESDTQCDLSYWCVVPNKEWRLDSEHEQTSLDRDTGSLKITTIKDTKALYNTMDTMRADLKTTKPLTIFVAATGGEEFSNTSVVEIGNLLEEK